MRRNYFFSRNRDALLEPCDGKLSRTVLRGESPRKGADLLDTHGSLISADFDKRIIHQMEAISPFVDKILVYQYLGIMNKPGSLAHAGLRDESVRLYNQYMDWYRKQNFK